MDRGRGSLDTVSCVVMNASSTLLVRVYTPSICPLIVSSAFAKSLAVARLYLHSVAVFAQVLLSYFAQVFTQALTSGRSFSSQFYSLIEGLRVFLYVSRV